MPVAIRQLKVTFSPEATTGAGRTKREGVSYSPVREKVLVAGQGDLSSRLGVSHLPTFPTLPPCAQLSLPRGCRLVSGKPHGMNSECWCCPYCSPSPADRSPPAWRRGPLLQAVLWCLPGTALPGPGSPLLQLLTCSR